MERRYSNCLILGAVGDAMGYNNGKWEFNKSGQSIHREVQNLGGVENLDLKLFRVSDDTVMALATGEALIEAGSFISNEHLLPIMLKHYIKSMKDMHGRGPGVSTMKWLRILKKRENLNDYCIPYNKQGGGCGAAMRSVPIGLRFPHTSQYNDLIRVAVESSRLTHHNAVGYLGSVAVALFTSYAIQKIPLRKWGMKLLTALPDVLYYINSSTDSEVEEHKIDFLYFEEMWRSFLSLRNILDGRGEPQFPSVYGVNVRDKFYKSLSFSGWGGSSGHDAPMIAYDALLGAGNNWTQLCERAMLHGGDSDSTGILAGSWFGLMYGIENVPDNHYLNIEKFNNLCTLAEQLYTFYE